MFHSAVVKLTAWYLLILMSISLLFSIAIYQGATGEIGDRLSQLQSRFEQPLGLVIPSDHDVYTAFRDKQWDAAGRNLMTMLVYVNILIFFGGGLLSYLLARRTLRQLEHAHETQSRFTSDASHELRTPLAAMKSELEVALRDTKMSKADMRELLASNLEEVNKLTTLSKTLLQLSRLDHANLERKNVPLNSLVEEVVQRYDKNATRIELSLPKEPLLVHGNEASIEELITILVDNALKYGSTRSKIKATVKRTGKDAMFSISNKGQGIPADKLPHIFDRFYRANDSRTDGGAGLGLALAKEIVLLHKGELSVASQPRGDTTFAFALPLVRKTKA